MFYKFLTNEDCMKVLGWFLEHPDGEYSATIVNTECENMDVGNFMASITILQGVEILNIDEEIEDLGLSLNKDSSITQLLSHFKDEFNDLAFRNANVSSALSYLTLDNVKEEIDRNMLSQVIDPESLLDLCRNYEDLDLDDEMNQKIYDMCKELSNLGVYDDFLEYIESLDIK